MVEWEGGIAQTIGVACGGGEKMSGLPSWILWRARGQGLIEYALIFAVLVLVVVGTLILFGPQIASIYKNIENAI